MSIVKISHEDDFIPMLYPNVIDPTKNIIDMLIVEPENGSVMKLSHCVDRMMRVLQGWKVKRLVCRRIELFLDKGDTWEVLPDLRGIEFVECVEVHGFVAALIYLSPSLRVVIHECLQFNRPVNYIDVVRAAWRCLEHNYGLIRFRQNEFESRVKVLSLTGNTTHVLLQFHKNMEMKLKRNQKGYDRCRQAIYQLFLIRNYFRERALENPFGLLDRNVVKMIALMVYETIGTKIWCN